LRTLLQAALVLFIAGGAAVAGPDGGMLYAQRCAVCHERPASHAPPRSALANRSSINIVMALMTGAMRPQAAGLSHEQVNAIASYLTAGTAAKDASLRPNRCTSPVVPVHASGWNGWGQDLANSRFQPHSGLTAQEVRQLKVKWVFAYPGQMTWGQPTVVNGKVFVSSTTGQVFALDARSGCTLWSIEVGAPVRSAIFVGPGTRGHEIAYFGDVAANVHAVDADTGRELWHVHVDDHPMARITGSPVLFRDRLLVPVSSFEEGAAADASYGCCTFRGSVVALDAATGKRLWKRRTIEAEPKPYRRKGSATGLFGPAGGSVWNAPTIDPARGLLYVGTGNDYTDIDDPATDAVLAIDVASGQIRWAHQLRRHDRWAGGCTLSGPCPKAPGPDADFAASVILMSLPSGGDVLVAGQKSGVVYGLDPASGKVRWRTKVGVGSIFGGIEWGMAAQGSTVFVPISDSLPGKAGRGRPGLAALDAASGKMRWWSAAPQPVCAWGSDDCRGSLSQAVTAIQGYVFAGSQDGHLRAYDSANGKVVWDLDTGAAFVPVNAPAAHGGSLDSGGPAVVDGVVYVNSGYGQFLGRGGNVLLALSVAGR
jgi:polyvinyl alcohol dehydrogenase (cytochrome)